MTMTYNGMETSNLSDALINFDAMTTLPSHMSGLGSNSDSLNSSPYSSLTEVRLEIVEQPKSRGFRFRYDCEGQSHGGLPGENSEKNRRQKTYPTVHLKGYRGRARVMVSLVTDTDPAMPHAHSIVGKNSIDGRCVVEIGPETDMYAQFTSLGILHVTKKKVPEVLTRRLLQQAIPTGQMVDQMEVVEIDASTADISAEDHEEIKQQAQSLAKSMNLSVVRLCFQAFIPDEHGRYTIPIEPVFSNKVYDSKAPSAGTLKICRLDRTSGSVKGGDDVFLLCDKVQKNDIEVLFYEDKQETTSGMQLQPWMAKGRFGPNDVHHQYAVVFQTPTFYNQAIEHPVQVWIALKRPSDHETSEPKPFLYLPQEFDEERIGQKRRKKISHFNNFFEGGGGGAGGGGGGAGTGGGNFFSGDFNYGRGGSYNSGFNFFGGTNSSSGGGGGGGGGGGSAGTGGNGGGTGFSGVNATSAMAPTIDSLYSTLPQSTQSHIFAATATNPGALPAYSSMRPPTLGYANGVGQQVPMYHPQQLQQFLPVGSGHMPSRSGGGVVVVKKEPHDYYMDVIERDNGPLNVSQQVEEQVIRSKDQLLPQAGASGQSGNKLDVIGGNVEDVESGYVESSERLDSGLPASMSVDPAQETATDSEADEALKALKDRQQMAFEVCDRMFNALLAWATTKDIRYLLAAQRSLTAVQNQEGDTALHLAIIHNHQDVVLQLLDVLPQLPPTETPVVDCLNNFKQSPVHLAVITRQHKVVQYLLKANANPLVSDRNGDTPLHLACKYGFLQGIVPLLNRSTRINTEGCRIPELVMRNNDGLTPLHLAAVCGSPNCFKELVKAHADVNVQDSKSGKSALHYLIEKGDLPLTGFLITEPETNIECTDFSGNTPLHCAAALGNVAIVSLLIAAGANLVCQNQEGEFPLVLGEYGGHDEVVKVLKESLIKAGLDKPEEQLSTQMQSVSLTEEDKALAALGIEVDGDLGKLDFRPRISLALILDPPKDGGDWKALAKCLSLSHLEGGLEAMTSPTKELLTMYEACDGTIAKLRQALLDINRSDAVNIIDRYMNEDRGVNTTSKSTFDSNVSSNPQSLSEQGKQRTSIPSTQV